MPDPTLTEPLIFVPSMEVVAPDEAETQKDLDETLLSISRTTFKDGGRALRSVHAKSHAVVSGTLEVLGGLPEPLRQGVFAKPGSYPVVMRFSTNPGDILDDNVSTPRGLAIKIVGVEGARLPGSEADATQDFVMADSPAFAAADTKAFLRTLKLLAATTDKPEILKKAVSATMRGVEAMVSAFGGKSATAISLGGHPKTNLLGETYYSQVPLLFGSYVAKVAVAPVSAALVGVKDAPVDLDGKPDGLRAAVEAFFASNGGEWEVRAQLCTGLDAMPIEDASVAWPEDESPYRPVARIRVDRQTGWSEARDKAVDALSFSPWHGLAAHRPLGSIMRARKASYEASAHFRAEAGRCPIHEPRGGVTLP